MKQEDIDILSEYYQYELSYLRNAGSDFAVKFPKIARRLDLSHNESSDPQIERLIESFAFLAGKLQKQIDDQFPEIAYALLGVLYKPLILPIPSCVMVNFDIDSSRAAKAAGFSIPKNTQLNTISNSGESCYFMTAHDLELWPAEILSAEIIQRENIPSYYATATYYLKLRIAYPEGVKQPKKMRFYINADALLRGKIFSAIFSSDARAVFQKKDQFEFLSKISPVGVEEDDSLFPYPNTVHKGFRLLQEYFTFPDKFFGFDLMIPDNVDISGENFIYIPMGYNIFMQVSYRNFSLSTVPAINLFPKVTEPLRLDYKQVEYCLVPDYRRYNSTEIYTIEKMVAIDPVQSDEIYIPEFFSCDHDVDQLKDGTFWKSRRKKSYMKNGFGEDVYISFIDTNFNPYYTTDKIFYAYTLCMNRGIAEQIPVLGELQIELSIPVKKIYCVDRPTAQKPSIRNGKALWKLISALALNSVSFSNSGIKKIQEVLNIFADIAESNLLKEVDAILSIESTITTKRIDEQTWRGFIRGAEIEITFDEALYNLGIPLSLVLAKFLSSYTTINTFTDVTVKARNKVLRKWEQQFGIQNYL